MTTTVEPRRVRRRVTGSDPRVVELDELIARNPGWYEELSAEKRRLLGETAQILGA